MSHIIIDRPSLVTLLFLPMSAYSVIGGTYFSNHLSDKFFELNKYFELKPRGAAAPTRTTCFSSQLLVRVVVHQDHIMSVY